VSVEHELKARQHAQAALDQLVRAVRLDPDRYQAAHDAVRDALDDSTLKENADNAAGGRWTE
jgi:hypothetical protein